MSRLRMLTICFACTFFPWICYAQKISGPLILKSGVEDGYTLFAPLNDTKTYLIDNCGRVVNKWKSEFTPGNTAYLLPNGNLLRTKKLPNTIITGGGGGGGVELFDWNSNLIWSFELNDEKFRLHHDVAYLSNGNILMIVWELKTQEEALAVGRNPELIPGNGVIWSEQIIEVKPISINSFEIVWKWLLWDHLVQDFDDEKNGFGQVSDHPELVDINYVNQGAISDWIHANSLDYNEELDQVVIGSPFFNEFWIIDHSTTMEEAASHSGGNTNRGGDLLYRWGNPKAYKSGTVEDQKLFGQHDVHWIKEQNEQSGNIILFNNNIGVDHSSVEVVNPTLNENFGYDLIEQSYGPTTSTITYKSTPADQFHSRIMGGVQSLPNNNLLICSSLQGLIFEVTPDAEIVWRYKSPITVDGIEGRDFEGSNSNFVSDNNFRATKYSKDYSAFNNIDLIPKEPIEGEPWIPCSIVTEVEEYNEINIEIFPNPVHDELYVESPEPERLISIRLLTLQGQIIYDLTRQGKFMLDVRDLNQGLYILLIDNKLTKIIEIK
ncbi:MAG: aryl-sulfate sulfotransferase [Cyclobacteriaceae bacterium]